MNLSLNSHQHITVSPGDILTCSVKEYRNTMSIQGRSETFTQLTRFVFLLDKLSLVSANCGYNSVKCTMWQCSLNWQCLSDGTTTIT